jgi:CDGSH-type Zn-finger protein
MSQVTIKARDNGPFLVEGPVTIVDAAGGVFQIPPGKPAVALCRCGQSKNKPFCDGSHKTCNFMAAERAPASSAAPAAPPVVGIAPPPTSP